MSFTKVAPAGIGTEPGSAIRIGDSLLHSTGLDIGTGSGIGVTIRQHGDATFTGIITASAFFGDGSGLEGVSSSGIGTPLSDDDTSTLNKAYYVNQELSIGSTVTVNHPSSAVASYTHYQDIVVTGDADFIVADGDTFIPDVLGINTSTLPNAVSSATGGRIRAGTITNAGANGAVNFPNGLVATSATFTGVLTYEDVTNVDSIGIITARGGIRIGGGTTVGPSSGIVTYFGDGSQLTGISVDSTKIETGNTKVETVDTGSDGHVKITTEGSERLRIISTGLMGVGTQNPQKNLHLYSSGVTTLRIETGDSRGQAWDILSTNGAQNNTGTLSFRDESGSAYLEFGANEGSPQFRVRNGGANDLLHVDNNGTVTKSKHPIFATKINYVNSYVSSGTKIPMQAAHIDTRSSFSDSNDRYTAPAAGRYLFYFFSNIDYNGDGTIAVRFHRNGSEFTSGEGGHIYSYAQNSGWHGLCGQIITNMAVNDYMEVFTSASNMKVDGNNYGQFGGYMIG